MRRRYVQNECYVLTLNCNASIPSARASGRCFAQSSVASACQKSKHKEASGAVETYFYLPAVHVTTIRAAARSIKVLNKAGASAVAICNRHKQKNQASCYGASGVHNFERFGIVRLFVGVAGSRCRRISGVSCPRTFKALRWFACTQKQTAGGSSRVRCWLTAHLFDLVDVAGRGYYARKRIALISTER